MTSRFFKTYKSYIICLSLLIVGGNFTSFSVSAQKVRLRSQITPACNSGTSRYKFADIYADGNIAVQGSYNCRGAFIYDISDPDQPRLAAWYNPGSNIQFLEAIVIGTRAYFGSGNGGGVHIVDLTNPSEPRLLGVVNAGSGNGYNSIHEMVIWGNYLIENYNGFSSKILKVINISDPANPVFIRDIDPSETVWVHAMHIRGNRLFTSGWGSSTNRGRTEIYDITNIATQEPTLLGYIEDSSAISAGNNMHSSWTSEDGNFLFSCRETTNGNGDLRVYDIRNPAQALLVNRITMADLGLNAVTPHNPVVMGNLLYVSWYQAGVQIFDISDPVNLKRVGQYDTYQPAFVEKDAVETLAAEPWDLICGIAALESILPTTYDGNWAVYPFLGNNKLMAGDMSNGLLILDASQINAVRNNAVSDFDGDGKTDLSVYTSDSGFWKINNSASQTLNKIQFGIRNDILTPADYDGDGKTDIAVWRPSEGIWYVQRSFKGFYAEQFGMTGDVPVPADYDADGKIDIAVWRPSNGVWYIQQSTLGFKAFQWGAGTDRVFTGDYDNDGKADLVAYRPSNGVWHVLQSSSSLPIYKQFGINTDQPLSGDFDGDGISDFAVYRRDEGRWYILNSNKEALTVYQFGAVSDTPIPADFDGDGKTDIAVYRPGSQTWYLISSGSGSFSGKVFGESADVPSPRSVQPR